MRPFLFALGVTFLLTGTIVPLLRRAQLMDIPNPRSSHHVPVPRGGGLAVVASIVVVVLTLGERSLAELVLLVVMVGTAAVGLADDAHPLATRWRLAAQAVAGLAISAWVIQQDGEWWQPPVVVLLLMAFVNAFNFMDGINGISAMVAAVAGAWWWWIGSAEGSASLALLGAVLVGASLGFLPWNAPKARVFLGDVGSYGIGSMIVVMSVLARLEGIDWLIAIAPLLVYFADTGWVLVKRYLGGRSLGEPHREHVYQRLVDGGWTHFASAGLCAVVGLLACLASLLVLKELRLVALGLITLLVTIYLSMPWLLADSTKHERSAA